jgi:uncharacterized tellurite resistance protein B-like protein
MFDRLIALLKTSAEEPQSPDDLRVAVAVLLLEAAHMDDKFGQEEREVIERLLMERFDLSEQESKALTDFSEERIGRVVQLHPYTRTCFTRMPPEQRVQLIEMLWEVAYADGVLDAQEDALLRRISNLIYITDRERIHARQRVLARMGKNRGTLQ